jgi:hypothetical protein
LEQIHVRGAQTESDEESEGAVEKFFDGSGFAEGGEGGVHLEIILCGGGV